MNGASCARAPGSHQTNSTPSGNNNKDERLGSRSKKQQQRDIRMITTARRGPVTSKMVVGEKESFGDESVWWENAAVEASFFSFIRLIWPPCHGEKVSKTSS